MSSLFSIHAVWLRYFAVFRKNVLYGTVTTLVEPVLYLLSFGFGLGALVGGIRTGAAEPAEVSYRAFVLAGIVGQTLLFQGFFEAAYGSFIRMYYQKIFQAISVTPVTLSEVLWGELAWDSTRATFAGVAVLLVGIGIGDFSVSSVLVLVPFCFLSSLVFSALGLLVAAKSRTIESISYPQYLLVFPMFLFCGVFFPLENLPEAIRLPVKFLPLTPVLSVIRSLALGFPFETWQIGVLMAWVAILVPWARKSMTQRLVQ